MKETLYCPGILGQASYRSEQVSILFRCNHFLLSYCYFLSKNSSEMHSQRPNTKETFH